MIESSGKGRQRGEDHFPRPSLIGRFGFSQPTFVEASSNEKDAPTPAVRGTEIEP